MSDRCPSVGGVEGTLSLFDWRPAPVVPDVPERMPEPLEEVAAGSGPCAAPAEDGEAGAPPHVIELPRRSTPVAHPVAHPGARIVIFDCETTGTDRQTDQVIELCVQRGLSDGAPSQTWRIKPTAPIHPGALAVHGITAADLADCPSFAEIADEIAAVFAEIDVIVGYNIAFDIDMLQAEYSRLNRTWLDFQGKLIVDAFRLWQHCEPRSLQHAHQRFVGDEFAAAHSARADVAATGRVLAGMIKHFGLDEPRVDWNQIATVSDPNGRK